MSCASSTSGSTGTITITCCTPQTVKAQGPGSGLAAAIGGDAKGKLSPVLYAVGIPLAFVNRWMAVGCYVAVALIWLIPDRRIETAIER